MITVEKAMESLKTQYSFLTNDCIESIESHARLLFVKKGEKLIREGQYANKTYFIVSGAARTFYLKDGKDITDWLAFENDFICSINSFFLGIPSELYIEALEESAIFEFSREDFFALSEKFADFDQLGKLVVTQTMLQLQQRIVSIQFESAEQKLKNLLLLRPDILQRVQLTHIASFLGITLETLSRIRKRDLT